MITIKSIASIAAILLPLAAVTAAAQTPAPELPSGSAPQSAPKSPPSASTPDAGMAKLQAACKTDIDRYCATGGSAAKKPAAGTAADSKSPEQIVACMTTNEAKLTAACKSVWTERKAAMKGKP
jgi:hypothetical protein